MRERSVSYDGKCVRLLDQRILPHRVEVAFTRCVVLNAAQFADFMDAGEVAGAIKSMVVRGAPAIGAAAAYGLALTAAQHDSDAKSQRAALESARETLEQSRPTAVNLMWALRRMMRVLDGLPEGTPAVEVSRLLDHVCWFFVPTLTAAGEQGHSGGGRRDKRMHRPQRREPP